MHRETVSIWERSPHGSDEGFPFDLRALRYVLAAAEHRSFTAAAQAMGARVSSVSRRIRDFEDQIGVAFFERTSAGVRLTDAGSSFLDDVVPALYQLESVVHHARAAGRVEHGTVRIGIFTTLAGGVLRELVTSFRRAHPGVQFQFRDGSRRDHLHSLRLRRLDIAFLVGNTDFPDCDIMELWRERVHIAMPAAHPLAFKASVDWPELRGETFLVTQQDPGQEIHHYIARRISGYGVVPEIRYQPVRQETLLHVVAMGEGIAVVSEAWNNMVLPDLVLRPLVSDEDLMPISAAWSPLNDNPALRRFISFAKAEIKGLSRQ